MRLPTPGVTDHRKMLCQRLGYITGRRKPRMEGEVPRYSTVRRRYAWRTESVVSTRPAQSIYWAIVTLTTVGYGDITPVTAVGQLVSTIVMLLGYSIIAVPTGIISAEMTKSNRTDSMVAFDTPIRCPRCNKRIRRHKARYCDQCGYSLFTHGHTVVPNTYKPEGDTGSNE